MANGVKVPHGGFVSTDAKFAEGNQRAIRWNNADVEIQILSTKELNSDNGRLSYDEDEGRIINKMTGDPNHFISANGVCFCKLFLSKHLCGESVPSMDFGRPR